MKSEIDLLDMATEANQMVRNTLTPLANSLIGKHSSYTTWKWGWNSKTRELKITQYDASGYMDSQTSKTKEWTLKEDEVRMFFEVGGDGYE